MNRGLNHRRTYKNFWRNLLTQFISSTSIICRRCTRDMQHITDGGHSWTESSGYILKPQSNFTPWQSSFCYFSFFPIHWSLLQLPLPHYSHTQSTSTKEVPALPLHVPVSSRYYPEKALYLTFPIYFARVKFPSWGLIVCLSGDPENVCCCMHRIQAKRKAMKEEPIRLGFDVVKLFKCPVPYKRRYFLQEGCVCASIGRIVSFAIKRFVVNKKG